MAEKEYKIWAMSDLQPDGVYMVTISFSDDDAFTLTDDKAFLYASAIIEIANIAEYEAAILAQLKKATKMAEREAAEFIAKYFRPKRSIPVTGTPVSLIPGISIRTKKAFLIIKYGDKEVGQWDYEDAMDHAHAVLDIITVARLDNIYHHVMKTQVGVDDDRARNIIADLAKYHAIMKGE